MQYIQCLLNGDIQGTGCKVKPQLHISQDEWCPADPGHPVQCTLPSCKLDRNWHLGISGDRLNSPYRLNLDYCEKISVLTCNNHR